jgi:hypothetical protein
MSLSTCRECGQQVSTEAVSCPHCGVPDPMRSTPTGPPGPQPVASPFRRPTPQPPQRITRADTPSRPAVIKSNATATRHNAAAQRIAVAGLVTLGAVLVVAFIAGPSWGIVALLVALVFTLVVLRQARQPDMYCPHCGNVGPAEPGRKGSPAMEFVLWLCFFVPGLLYTVWRRTSRPEVCGTCHQRGLIPTDSPRVAAMRRQGG